MQSVISARRCPVRSSSYSAVASSIAPVAPSGCPRAMAPPLGFTFSIGIPSSCATTSGTGANASLISKTSMSPIFSSAAASALRVAGIGPVSISTGSLPATAIETMRARGLSPRLRALPFEAITTAAAPSTMPDEFPACSTPFSLNDGFSPASVSSVVPGRGCSSRANARPPMSSGTISRAKYPFSIALAAFCCEPTANSSSWRRV